MIGYTRADNEAFAAAITSGDPDAKQAFFPLLRQQIELNKQAIPAVTILFKDLKVQVEASNSAASIPSLPNVLKRAFQTLTCQGRSTQALTILNSLSGTLVSGRLTLLLGPPSCGKTTLLKALAGRIPRSGYSGEVTYNGHPVDTLNAARTALLVAQNDTHIPALTARETAAFAFDIQNNPEDLLFRSSVAAGAPMHPEKGTIATSTAVDVDGLAPGAAPAELSPGDLARLAAHALDGRGRVDTVMAFFALLRCKDTAVGSAMARGISGGERKRLSTVEMLMGQQRVVMLDEISTGLDSATLFGVIRWLRVMTHELRLTTLISLLQPPPETFALFDDVMVMNEGTVLYHGPVAEAVPFMTGLGFHIPPRKDVPSFLQEVTTVRGQLMYASDAMREAHEVPSDLDPTDEVAVAEWDLLVPLDEMARGQTNRPSGGLEANGPGDGALVPRAAVYPLPFLPSLKLVLARQRTLFLREPTLIRARIGQCIILGLIIGGLWFNQPITIEASRAFLGAIFLAVMFFGFGGMPQLAVSLQNRAVWFKQRDASLYTASAYAWAQSLVQVPISVLEGFLFALVVYFMIGFSTDGAAYFFIFALVLLSASLAITQIFRLIGSLFHSPPIANAVAGFTLLLLIVNSGFIIVRSAIPPWVVYFYWVSPFAYSVRALAINEFTSPRWDFVPPAGTLGAGQRAGDVALTQFDFYTERHWIWIGVAFNVAFFIVTTQLSALALQMLKPPKPLAVLKSPEQMKADLAAARRARKEAQDLLLQASTHPLKPTSGVHSPRAPESEAGTRLAKATRVQSSSTAEIAAAVSERERSSREQASVASTLQFTPITLVWRNVEYYVPVPKKLEGEAAKNVMPAEAGAEVAGKKRLLNDLTGYAEPGVLTALMGGSGAGKTTLMDVLCGRKTRGVMHGEILVNGHPKAQDTWARVVGYVEQTDVHSGGLTVEESLQYSAGLRLTADVDPPTRHAYLLEVLLVTELLDIRGNLVGEAGLSGLSVEQRRRLSIGVELVSNPSVVFMDEPTSGLDARSAAAVMGAVRNVAGNGRTVMVTVHQPSIEIFESFDRLVLLTMGGEAIYAGPLGHHSRDLVSYFQAVPGVTPLPPDYNPATWMLEVSGGGARMHVSSTDADFPTLYRASEQARHIAERADELAAAGVASHAPLMLATRYAAPFSKQLSNLTWKLTLVYWRYPSYTVGRLVATILTALVFGMTWWQEGELSKDPNDPPTIADVQNILGVMYSGMSFMGMTNLVNGVPVFLSERQVMYRERAAGMYAVLPFGIASGVVELPYLVAQAAVFVPITYFMIGFRLEVEPILLYLVIFLESISLYTFMGQFFVYLTPNAPIATLLGGLNHLLWNIFNGFLVPLPAMAAGWVWLNYIAATTYVIYGLGISQLGDLTQRILVPGYVGCSRASLDNCPTVTQFMEDYFGYHFSFRWWCALILLGFLLTFRIGAMVVLKLVNHQQR